MSRIALPLLLLGHVLACAADPSRVDPDARVGADGKTDEPLPDAPRAPPGAERRDDGAWRVPIELGASLQNPCFSPDGDRLVLTNWLGGYNQDPATIAVTSVTGGSALTITRADRISVNGPGSCWNRITDRITYSSDELDDEIYTNTPDGLGERRITDRPQASFEPSLSPDGVWIVFESHPLDVEDQGAIAKVRADGSATPIFLTDGSGDDRQPNWSPTGELIVFQSFLRSGTGDLDLFVMDPDGGHLRNVTQSPGSDDTDATFSPDGASLLYSSDQGGLEHANLFVIAVAGGAPRRATRAPDAYDGAPSWSPDGRLLAFESVPGDPDGSAGTSLWIIEAPSER